MIILLESVMGSSNPRAGGRLPEGWTGGIVIPSMPDVRLGIEFELDPPVLRARPEQMIGSKSRMQGKVMSEQSATQDVDVGIDVCKASLDIHILPANIVLQVPNSKKGHKQLIAALRGFRVRIIVMEATGKFHRLAHETLHAAGFPVAIANPLRARLFAKSIGVLAKTDRVDARMLAVYGATQQLKAVSPLPETIERLREIVRCREAAVGAKTALENQRSTANLACVRKQIDAQIKAAARAAEALESDAVAAVKDDPALQRRFEILVSIPGIGTITAVCLLANMPELGGLTGGQVAMLAGLAPVASESGQSFGVRFIRAGRACVRAGIYMAAQSAARHNPDLRAFYDRLVADGKEKKVAITAVMRKLIVLANALLKEDRLWTPKLPIAKPLFS